MYHRQSIELWLCKELFAIDSRGNDGSEVPLHLLASATLVDFPQFRDIHHLIPQILNLRPDYKTVPGPNYHQIEDSDKWEIYLEYRKIVSQFLIDHIYSESWSPTYWPSHCRPSIYSSSPDSYSASFFNRRIPRSQNFYVSLAKYLLSLLWEDPR